MVVVASRQQGPSVPGTNRLTRPVREGAPFPPSVAVRPDPTVAAILALQAAAGNTATSSLLQRSRSSSPGSTIVLQRVLIPPGQPGAGRLPTVEKPSLTALLGNNGFDTVGIAKARGEEIVRDLLDELFDDLKQLDGEIDDFPGKKPAAMRAREKRKTQIGYKYEQLLQVARDARQEADDTYAENLVKAAGDVERQRVADGKGGTKIFKKEEAALVPIIEESYGVHLSFVLKAKFVEDVFKHIRAAAHVPLAPALTPLQQNQLAAEKAAINAQLLLWTALANNAIGTNPAGTWGTSFGGAGPGFLIHRLPQVVFNKLQSWWIRKTNAYVTDSDTSDRALKMWRDPAAFAGLSPTLNYHVNIG
jgi:hypothetical protein